MLPDDQTGANVRVAKFLWAIWRSGNHTQVKIVISKEVSVTWLKDILSTRIEIFVMATTAIWLIHGLLIDEIETTFAKIQTNVDCKAHADRITIDRP